MGHKLRLLLFGGLASKLDWKNAQTQVGNNRTSMLLKSEKDRCTREKEMKRQREKERE